MRREKGFTLVELLIVLAIIAALSTVLVPNIPRWTNSAKAGVIESDISQIANAMIQYVNSEGGNLNPPSGSDVMELTPSSTLGQFFSKAPSNPFNGGIFVKTADTSNVFDDNGGDKYGFIIYDQLPDYVANKIKNDLGSDVVSIESKSVGANKFVDNTTKMIVYTIKLNQ